MIKKLWHKIIEKFTSKRMVFSFAISFLFLCFLTFTFITAQVKYLTYISYIIAAWGMLIIIFSLFKAKLWNKGLVTIPLLIFIVSYLISSIIFLQYGILENAKGIVWLSLELIPLFLINKGKIESKYLKYFLLTFIYLSTTYAFISLIMATIGYMHYPTSLPGDLVPGGMAHGRLYGLYADPNYGAITSTLCILSCLFLYNKNNTKTFIWLTSFISLINIAYISLSGSRSGLIALVVSSAVVLFLYMKIKSHKAIFISILSSCILAVGLLGINIGIEAIYENAEPQILKALGGPVSDPKHAYTLQFADMIREECGLANPYKTNNGTPETKQTESVELKSGEVISEHVGVLGREENSDVTNQRKDIWLSAIDLFKASPIFGLSNRNYVEFAKENTPDTYIAQTEIQSMHNIFVDVAVSQGLLGLMLWMLILLCIFIALIQEMRKNKSFKIIILFGCFIAYMVMGLFYTEMIYVNTIGSVYFWYVFGHLSYNKIYIKKEK